METTYDSAIAAMQPAISKLLQNYEGFGGASQIDNAEKPEQELNLWLEQLDIFFPGANKRKLKLAIRQFIITLSCFKYRVIAKSKYHTIAVWNPLEQRLSEFVLANSQYSITYHSNIDPYPTADIISDWVTTQLDEDMSAE